MSGAVFDCDGWCLTVYTRMRACSLRIKPTYATMLLSAPHGLLQDISDTRRCETWHNNRAT